MSTGRRDVEYSQPLLAGQRDPDTLFVVDDDDDHYEGSALREDSKRHEEASGPSFGPPLKSTLQSRETEYDLDEDELDEAALEQLNVANGELSPRPPLSRQNSEQRMPLLVGLLDSAALRAPESTQGIGLRRRSDEEGGPDHHEDLEELARKRNAGGGLLDSIANMANSILGAGIIGLPYAVKQAGFVTGVILLVSLCAVTDWTIRLIVVNAKLSGMAAFCVIIGDTMTEVMRSILPGLRESAFSFLVSRQFIIILFTFGISYPLSLYRDISKLARASSLGLLGMLIIVIAVFIEGGRVPEELRGDPSKRFSIINGGIFQAIGVIAFAFVCHHNSLLIYGSLNTPTLDRFAAVTHVSTFLSLIACCSLAITGFLVFTDKTQGNILNNFPSDDTLINVARFCFGLNMFTTFPLELFVCREVIEQYYFADSPWTKRRHIIITTVLVAGAVFISLLTCDLGVVLEVAGGVAATALAFIFPAGCYYKLLPSNQPWNSRAKLPAILCVGFGLVVLVLNLLIAIGHAWEDRPPKKCY
ncbi:hypothetical protein FRC17_009768 [Serendipita sp. 399]|nr:hypothetical protein FRC17_009768 [Serendipita sp. 399]